MSKVLSPNGLSVIGSIGSSFVSQTSTFFINSGYAQNIYNGSPVYLGNDGFIHALSEHPTYPILGVFQGCKYVTGALSDARSATGVAASYFPANTVSEDGNPIAAEILVDPNAIIKVQVADGLNALTFAQLQALVGNAYGLNVVSLAAGDVISGSSKAYLDVGVAAAAGSGGFVLGFSTDEELPQSLEAMVGTYPFVNVLLRSHQMLTRAVAA